VNLSNLTDLQLDAVREISGIGAGHAATSLSELVGRTIRLEVPTIGIVRIGDVAQVFGGREQIVGAVYARLTGEFDGGMLFMAAPEAVRALSIMLGESPDHVGEVPDARCEDALLSAIEKLISSYLRAVSETTGLQVETSGGAWAYDMAGALLEAAVAEIGMSAESAVVVRTVFIDMNHSVEVAFFFVPDPDSLDVILGRLGMS
jgi:chemotaxis protein CheC